MKLFFHQFALRPLYRLNHRSQPHFREGVFLKSETDDGVGFCEYFPHPELGDQTINEFLFSFYEQKSLAQKKALFLLDPKWSKITDEKSFFNHQFLKGDDFVDSSVIKYKLKHPQDFSFLSLFQGGLKIRIDANAMFDTDAWADFERTLRTHGSSHLDYIEDPLLQPGWEGVSLTRARDFIMGSPYEVKIFKPYREFFEDINGRTIFSGNMGHGLSNYQTYLELIEKGDLSEYHGILTDGLYTDLPKLFSGDYKKGFKPDITALKKYFSELEALEWTSL